MTQTITIPAHEGNAIRVFAINLSFEDIADALATPETQVKLVADLLGASLDAPKQAEIIAIEDLEGLGLTGFLREGPGIPEDMLAPHVSRLDALMGHILLLYPNAFLSEVTLNIGPDLTFIADLKTDAPDWSDARILESEAATTPAPRAGKKKPSDAAMSGRIATYALLVLGLLTWLMIWIA
ncbi:MAG: hypothetical protein ABJL99_13560 [Aliishimia sp.]